MKKVIIIIGVVIILIGGWFIIRFGIGDNQDDWRCVDGQWVKHGVPSAPIPTSDCGDEKIINNFEECATAGFAVMESYPRRCRDSRGNTFTEDIGNELAKQDLIRIDNPRPNQKITNPLLISGQARGSWFFEGDFPVVLTDWDGRIVAQGIARAQGEWMTEDFVSYAAVLEFDQPNISVSNKGTLILKRDNPSGLPENNDALELPVKF